MKYWVEHMTSKGWEICAEPLDYQEAFRIWAALMGEGIAARLTCEPA